MKKLVILLALLLPAASFAQINIEQIDDINGYPAFIITYDNHIVDLNETRSLVGAKPLTETPEMMLKSKERAIWAANNLEEYGHEGMDLFMDRKKASENAASNYGLYINTKSLVLADNKVNYIRTQVLESSRSSLNSYITYRASNSYNNSDGHYANRTNTSIDTRQLTSNQWTECGNALILFYKPGRTIEDREGNKRKVTGYVVWHYELFQ